MGSSKNKKFVAIGYKDRIEVTEGFQGSVVTTLEYPKKYNEALYDMYVGLNTDVFNHPEYMNLKEIKVSANGKKALLVSGEGIYLLEESKTTQLYPQLEKLEEMVDHVINRTAGDLAGFDLRLSYPNADFSIDDRYVVASSMIPSPVLAGTCIYKIDGEDEPELLKYGEQASMFGILNQFHDNGKDMLHAACLYASINTNWSDSTPNTTFRLDVSQIENGDDELDNFAGGYRQAPGRVLAACPIEDGFGLGVDGGYVWWQGPDASLKGYVHLGGEITAMDITPDKKYLVVGTNQGQVVNYAFISERGIGMITNMNLKDEKRYLFFRTFAPMVW